MRSEEAWSLQWIDINVEKRMVSVTPEKGGDPRALPISTELVAMLSTLSRRSDQVFNGSLRHFRRGFRKQRKRIASKLQNPRINHITFHTFAISKPQRSSTRQRIFFMSSRSWVIET